MPRCTPSNRNASICFAVGLTDSSGSAPRRVSHFWPAIRLVCTKPGQSALTRTGEPLACSSMNRPSLSATTADLVTLYGAAPGTATRPAIDAVLTMWPTPWSSMIGRKARMPWTTP